MNSDGETQFQKIRNQNDGGRIHLLNATFPITTESTKSILYLLALTIINNKRILTNEMGRVSRFPRN